MSATKKIKIIIKKEQKIVDISHSELTSTYYDDWIFKIPHPLFEPSASWWLPLINQVKQKWVSEVMHGID